MKYVIYAIFLLIAFSSTSIFGHIYLVEIPAIIGLLIIFFKKSQSTLKLNALDKIVFVYAAFSLISVAVGLDSFYESARHYRLMVFTPVLIYVVIRFGSINIDGLKKSIFYIIPGTLWQGALFIQYYIMHGSRPVGVEGAVSTITLSVLFSISLLLMLFNFDYKPKKVVTYFRYVLIVVLFLMLLVSGTRAALLGFVIMSVAIYYTWDKRHLRKWIGRSMLISIFSLLMLVVSGSILFSGIQIENIKEKATSVERVFDIDMYLWDISGRIDFWGRITNKALENPVFGSGGASHSIGKSGGTAFELGSAHNVLVSTIVTSGIPGLIILLSIIWYAYRPFSTMNNNLIRSCYLGKVLLGSISVLLMVAITNDFSGGRIFIWFMLLALISRMVHDLSSRRYSDNLEDSNPNLNGTDSIESNNGKNYTGVRLRS